MNHQRDQFDQHLRTAAPAAAVRPNLATTTLRLSLQARRARHLRRWLAVIIIFVVALGLAKWLKQDALYLAQLAFTKTNLVRLHAGLYLSSIWESLPKGQIIAAAASVALWLVWRNIETSLIRGRITNINHGNTMKLIILTPRLAAASIMLATTALGVSGYSYAQKNQQHQLEILRSRIGQSGRVELQTSPGSCAKHAWSGETDWFEVKKGIQLSAADTKATIQAACQQAAAEAVIEALYLTGDRGQPIYQLTAINGTTLTLSGFAGPNKPASWPQNLEPGAHIFDLRTDSVATIAALKPGVIIAPIEYFPTAPNGLPIDPATGRPFIHAAVILPDTPAITWYDPAKLNQVSRITTCTGNPADRCSDTGAGIDFFPASSSTNPAFVSDRSLQLKEIAGVITDIQPSYTIIKTSSGRMFRLNFGSNPADYFNRYRKQLYNNDPVASGDTLLVRYEEAAGQHDTTINSQHLFNAVVSAEILNKSDPKQY